MDPIEAKPPERIISLSCVVNVCDSYMVGDSYLDMSGLFGVIQNVDKKKKTIVVNTMPTIDEYRDILEERTNCLNSTLNTNIKFINVGLLCKLMVDKINKIEAERKVMHKEKWKVYNMFQKREEKLIQQMKEIEKLEEDSLVLQEQYGKAMSNHNAEIFHFKKEIQHLKKKLEDSKFRKEKGSPTIHINKQEKKEHREIQKREKRDLDRRRKLEKKALIVY